jgi:hypothetical protein
MKIYVANSSHQKIGGGFSFIRHFKQGMGNLITEDYNQADVYFIASPSMVQRDDVFKARDDGKKIVLRIDNAVRNSRNRNTGMTRMKDFAMLAHQVIYQSEWAKDYLQPYVWAPHPDVIINGIDLDLFSPPEDKGEGDIVLYSRYNRDETKNYEVARYWYGQHQLNSPEAKLLIVGQFSDELRQGNFDFYNNESFQYLGALDYRAMAKVYKLAHKFLYTYFNDACSNSLIEALCSGCEIVGDEYYRGTGGAKQILDRFGEFGRNWFSIDRMCEDYKAVIEKL